jgi:hypothetical protein
MHDPATYTEAFDREQGFTPAEWLGSLRGAVGLCPLELGDGAAVVRIGDGTLQLQWTELPPRQIALMRMPRLAVRYRFNGVPPRARTEFMRYFDLFMQRGGG